MNEKSDQQLMALIRDRQRSALETLYDRYVNVVYSFALKMTKGDTEATKDIVQQVFMRIWTTKSLYEENKGAFVNWILTITRNLATDHLRKENAYDRKASLVKFASSDTADVDAIVSARLMKQHVREAKSRLTPAQQRLLHYLYWEGMTIREIAAQEQQPIGTVKSRLHQSLKQLRRHLRSEREGETNHGETM
ncbi:MAG TPA: sigma-70 family RNA polymerase sigma factor [Bacillales bacterium]|nr:sigma-70 family RNA polymerase sigma factor [Bacillales bacterium]